MSDILSSSPDEVSRPRIVSAQVTHDAPTAVLDDIAAGEVVLRCWAEVTEAFNAGTTNVLTLGDGTDVDKYLAAGDVTETATGVSADKGPFAAETAAGTLTATFTETGTAATTGEARVYCEVASVPA